MSGNAPGIAIGFSLGGLQGSAAGYGVSELNNQRRKAADTREAQAAALAEQRQAMQSADEAANKANQNRPNYADILYDKRKSAARDGAASLVSIADINAALSKNTMLG